MLETGISVIFNFLVEMFGLMYTSSIFIFQWFTTPIAESLGGSDPPITDLEILMLTPFELMFGVGLISILVFAFIKFFTNIV